MECVEIFLTVVVKGGAGGVGKVERDVTDKAGEINLG